MYYEVWVLCTKYYNLGGGGWGLRERTLNIFATWTKQIKAKPNQAGWVAGTFHKHNEVRQDRNDIKNAPGSVCAGYQIIAC